MKLRAMVLVLVFCFSISAQDIDSAEPACGQPLSYKYSQFQFKQIDSSKNKLDEIAKVVKENEGSQAVAIVYAGRRSAGHEASSISYQLGEYMRIEHGFSFSKFWYVEGGFREDTSVDLFIKPFECSETPKPTPTLELEDIEFKELNSLPKDVLVKTKSELLATVTKRVEPRRNVYAAALKQVGKVALSVVIDKDGKVVRAYSFYGDSYLTTSAEIAVKQWEFSPTEVMNKSVRAGGIVIIEFKIEDAEILD